MHAALGERIAVATAIHCVGELLRGTVFLIGGALEQMGAGCPGGEQSTETLMNKILQWTEVVERTDLPMPRQVVTVVFEGRDPVAGPGRASPRQRTASDDVRTRGHRRLRRPGRRTGNV
ncbi:hypothetical protein [Streptomyces sp. OE57]|uniref:hypothetical protein n=1 Tax=Streptomyces lacaronensis TaxID=3379885 RepID=UPI0039B74748